MKKRNELPAELRDYRNIQRLIWAHKGWTQPDPIAQELIEHVQHGPEKLVLMAHRESTKTSSLIAAVLGRYLEDVDYKVLYTSGTPNLAYNTSYEAFNLLKTMELFEHLRPLDSQRRSVQEGWDIRGTSLSKECSFQPTSLESSVTGGRANWIILDDPENKKNSLSVTGRARVRSFVTEYLSLKKSNQGSRFTVLMTPHVEDSLINWLRDRGFTVIGYPARFPTIVDMARWRGVLAPSLVKRLEENPGLHSGGGEDGSDGQPINPWRLGEEWCRSKLAEVKWNEWQMQYMLNTSPEAQTRPLRLANFIVYPLDKDGGPEKITWGKSEIWSDLVSVGINNDCYYKPAVVMGYRQYEVKKMTIDPASGGTDEIAFSIGGVIGNQIFVLANGGMLMRSNSPGDDGERIVMMTLAKLAVHYGVHQVIIESNLSMFASVLSPLIQELAEAAGISIGVEAKPTHVNKESRIVDTLAPVLYDHRVILNHDLVEKDFKDRRNLGGDDDEQQYMLAYQLTRIVKKKGCLAHDDRLDSLAALVTELEDFMKLNRDDAIRRHKISAESLRIEAYDKWVKSTAFYKARHPSKPSNNLKLLK